jgi:Rad3-related DNA helicase
MEKEKTILFVPTIEKANKIAKQINQTYSKSIALAYHSETKKDNVIETFSKQHSETKVLVVVDKLNE